MADKNLIPANEFCAHHNIEISFMNSLQEYGLAEVTIIEGNRFIDEAELTEIEKMVRLHYDLHINLEGIDAVRNLLAQIQAMQDELSALKNRLRLYEQPE